MEVAEGSDQRAQDMGASVGCTPRVCPCSPGGGSLARAAPPRPERRTRGQWGLRAPGEQPFWDSLPARRGGPQLADISPSLQRRANGSPERALSCCSQRPSTPGAQPAILSNFDHEEGSWTSGPRGLSHTLGCLFPMVTVTHPAGPREDVLQGQHARPGSLPSLTSLLLG